MIAGPRAGLVWIVALGALVAQGCSVSQSVKVVAARAKVAAAAPKKTLECTCNEETRLCFYPEVDDLTSLDLALEGGVTRGTPIVDLAQTFRLHSNPVASKVIYLDFNGHTTTGTPWNDATMGSSFDSPPFDADGNPAAFSDAELTMIQGIWQRVSSDFAPFGVDVTTQEPPLNWLKKEAISDQNWGIRVVITSYGPYSSSSGGIAYYNSFNWSDTSPVFVYVRRETSISEAISHEVGHSLNLQHDGTTSGATYYGGHGGGETAWAPIMGNSYNSNVTTWDNGVYTGTNNTQDDLQVIISGNGFSFLPDQIGNTTATAAPLTIGAGGEVSEFGRIEMRGDQDWFSFVIPSSGSLNLTFDPYWYKAYIAMSDLWGSGFLLHYASLYDVNGSTAWAEHGANLDISVRLLNGNGQEVATSNPDGLAAFLAVDALPANTYYLALTGVGFGDPTAPAPTGYSDYASIGNYWIGGTIVGASAFTPPNPTPTPTVQPTPTVLPTSTPTPTAPPTVQPTPTPTATPGIPLPSLTISNVSRVEGTSSTKSTFLVEVALSVASTSPVSVSFATAPGTASSTGKNADFVATSGTLTFAPGEVRKQISISVVADSKLESNEVFSVKLSGATEATIAGAGVATVTILNDDVGSTKGKPAAPTDAAVQ